MSKIPSNLDNDIDVELIQISDKLSPSFKAVGMTPNGITTLSLITGLISVYMIYKNKPIYGVLMYTLSYFFDCMDGYYARKYNMTSKFGDMYDHIKDMTVGLLMAGVLLYRNRHRPYIICIVLLIMYLMLDLTRKVMGCQEIYYGNTEHSAFLTMVVNKDEKDPEKCLKNYKQFGTGTLNVISILLIILI